MSTRAVIITKGIPDHPEGAIRFVRREQRDRWEKMGVCRVATETEIKEAARRRNRMFTASRSASEVVTREEPPVTRKKRGRSRKQ